MSNPTDTRPAWIFVGEEPEGFETIGTAAGLYRGWRYTRVSETTVFEPHDPRHMVLPAAWMRVGPALS